MIRRVLNLVVALALVGGGVVVAARIAEPSVRPVRYPPSASPTSAPPTIALATDPPASTTTAAPATTTTTVPVVATTVPTTTTTTTTVPVDEVEVLTAAYVWGPSRAAVLLQTVLGVEADGWYGPGTRQAHVAENEARGLSIDAVPLPPTTTTTTVAPVTAPAPTTTTVAPVTAAAPTTTAVPTTTVPPPSTTAGMFGGLGAKLVAQLLGQPCIADGDLSDCGPEVDALIKGLVN